MKKGTMFRLKIYDRLMMPRFLPKEGKYEIGVVCREIRKRIRITGEELKAVGFVTDDFGNADWDPKKDRGKAFPFTDLELIVIRKNLKRLDTEEKLPTDPRAIALYDLFMNSEGKAKKQRKGGGK